MLARSLLKCSVRKSGQSYIAKFTGSVLWLTTFDTLKFVRRLEQVGVPSEQAEAQAEVLTEAFNVNLEELVTKDYLAARFAEQKAYFDTRFVEQDANFKILYWMMGVVITLSIAPYLERLISL